MDATGVLGSVVLLDWATFLTYASFLGMALFGAVMRTLIGLYKAYTTYPDFEPSRVRMGVEILASTAFGLFATLILSEMGVFKFGLVLTALFAGLLGSDLIGLITKKLGLTKSMNVVLSERQMKDADLTENQARAMQYARMKGSIDNSIYRKINQTTHDVSKNELQSLVRKGRLSRTGKTRGVRYVPTERKSGENRANCGIPKEASLRAPGSGPKGVKACIMGCFEANRRVSQRPGRQGA